ncbi:MAG TPA: hypothetical protein VI483_02250 [Candidatus Paceibacterota bacterium]
MSGSEIPPFDAPLIDAAEREEQQHRLEAEDIAIFEILRGVMLGTAREELHHDGSASYFRIQQDGSTGDKPDLFLDQEQRDRYRGLIKQALDEFEAQESGASATCPRCGTTMAKDMISVKEWRWICPIDRTVVR